MAYLFQIRLLLPCLAAALLLSCDKMPKGDQVIITDQVLPAEGVGETYRMDTPAMANELRERQDTRRQFHF